MLTSIHINDFAIIDKLELEFDSGLSVMTGETGAGKSILIDALGLVLGDRADSSMVRNSASKANISASFDISGNQTVFNWLRQRELEMENECILRRSVNKEGGSRAYINGQPATLQALRELGEMLVDIHGQHAHQSLMKPLVQRRTLDNYSANEKILHQVKNCYEEILSLQEEREHLLGTRQDYDSRLQLLQYQVDELTQFSPQAGEPATLDKEHKLLSNANLIQEQGQACLAQLKGESAVTIIDALTEVQQQLEKLQEFDNRIGEISQLLDSARIQVEEAALELRHYLEQTDNDAERLLWVEERLSAYHELARKHHMSVNDIPELLVQLQDELTALQASQSRITQLDVQLEETRIRYFTLAKKLSQSRQTGARKFSKIVTENMQTLGLKGARFSIMLTADDSGKLSPNGLDHIEFMISTNPGEPEKALSKVASGGELSRISLCIQVIISRFDLATLIFDEVDVGVGGGVAELVGQKLRTLGEDRQVLCVTHLPQVAALGHHHFQVCKTSSGKKTSTGIVVLDQDTRVQEIARMLGGIELTAQTMAHAEEMVERARQT